MEEIKEMTDLKYCPILVQYLKNWMLRMYEGDAIIDDWHLWAEYVWLRDNNQLEKLFFEECLTNKLKEEIERLERNIF